MARVNINDPRYEKPITYYMNNRLYTNLSEKVKKAINQRDKDYVLGLDGAEGSGKSTFALQIGRMVDPTLDLSRVVFSAEDFRDAVTKAKKGQCIIYDEAITGLSSRASLSGVNRALISMMMQMRQKNLFVIIVLPTFFLLDKYVALFRAKTLIHVYESKGRRGYFKVYNRKLKKRLYLLGKSLYSYMPKKVKTRFSGRFYGVFALGDEKEEDRYRKKKLKALEASQSDPMTSSAVKYRNQRDILIYLLRTQLKISYKKLSSLFGDYDLEMSFAQIRNICAKFGIDDTDEEKEDESDDKDSENTGQDMEK